MIKVNNVEVVITRFPDGTFKFDLDMDMVRHVGGNFKIEWTFESMEELFTLQSLSYFLNIGSDTRTWSLHMPYVPNARMDKTATSNEGFMLEYFANTINSLNFTEVVVIDPHSDVVLDLIDRSVIGTGDHFMRQLVINSSKPDVIVFPDEGAYNRYKDLKMYNDIPHAYCKKVRNQITGEILSLELQGEVPEGSKVLIVDDICSRGGHSTTLHWL